MRTLIELYDERPLENILSTQVFAPERTVFICPPEIAGSKSVHSTLHRYFDKIHVSTQIVMLAADMYDVDNLLKVLGEVTDKYPGCVLDITGGTDQALFAAGVLNARKATAAFTYSRKSNTFFSISNAPFGESLACTARMSVEDFFLMAGGAVRKGRVDNSVLSSYSQFFRPFFDVYMRYKREWTTLVYWFQRVSAPVNGKIQLDVSTPWQIKGERGYISCNPEALNSLAKMGFIKQLRIETGKSVSFRFRDAQVRTWLRDIGSVLETYIYQACVDSKLFSDVCTSVVVDWEGTGEQSNVTNEIDVMASFGVVPVFISCKTCEIKTEALNELSVLKDRFGGKMARAAIVTTTKTQAITRRRAFELGIEVFDSDDMKKDRLNNRLKSLIKPIQ